MKEVNDREVLVKKVGVNYIAFRRSSPKYLAEGLTAKEARSNLSKREYSDLYDVITNFYDIITNSQKKALESDR